MRPITIKLLHERRNNNQHRKVDGRSGERYIFEWREAHLAYCYTATKQAEIDDLFSAQGRGSGSYFAPAIEADVAPAVTYPPLTDATVMELLRRNLVHPESKNPSEAVGLALVAAYDKGAAEAIPPAPAPVSLPEVVQAAPEPIVESAPAPIPASVSEDPAPAPVVPAIPPAPAPSRRKKQ